MIASLFRYYHCTRMPIRFRILIQNCFSIEWRENKNTIFSLSMGGAFAVDCPCFVLTRRRIMLISFCHHHVINQAQRKKDFHAERNSRCSGWPANELRYGRMLALQCAGGNLPPSGQISFILHGCFAIIFIYTGEKVKICCVDRAGNNLLWNTHQWFCLTGCREEIIQYFDVTTRWSKCHMYYQHATNTTYIIYKASSCPRGVAVLYWNHLSICTQRQGDSGRRTDSQCKIPMGAMKSNRACNLKISTRGIFTFPSVCCFIPLLSLSLHRLFIPSVCLRSCRSRRSHFLK